MGSSENESGVVDSSVGTIVWVRRRNGSWWPGKILGPEELSAAHLMSPRSGTPVKLLGREDASVDWYNLEKSKRVKSFRCGEFNDCIERAESSQGMPPKKREKYARREDAILHALELEKQLLEKKYGKLVCSSNGKSSKSSGAVKKESTSVVKKDLATSGKKDLASAVKKEPGSVVKKNLASSVKKELGSVVKKELATPSDRLGYGNEKHVDLKCHHSSKRRDISLEDKNMPHHAQKTNEGKPLNRDDSEVVPRMRGLQDFGLRIAPLRRKLSPSVTSDGPQKPAVDNNDHALPSGALSMGETVHTNSKNSVDKRKRAVEDLAEESLVRRRDRRRPLAKVLQSSTILPVSQLLQPEISAVSISTSGEEAGVISRAKRNKSSYIPGESSDCWEDKEIHSNQMVRSPAQFEESNCPHPATLSEDNMSGSTEDTETDSSETDSLDSETDEEMMALSDTFINSEFEPKSLGRYEAEAEAEHESTSSDEPDDVLPTGDMSDLCPRDPVLASEGVSKWQLKGKRNNRSFTKRSVDIKVPERYIYGMNVEEEDTNGCDEADAVERNINTRIGGFDNRGYSVIPKSSSRRQDTFSRNMIGWEEFAWNDQPAYKGFREDFGNGFDSAFIGHHPFGGRTKSMLFDVDLKVQSGYQRERVPMISLMSKYNGQAIVGHPIQIEALDTEILLSAVDEYLPEMVDKDATLPPVWRTARRTANFRVPRPHPSTAVDGDEIAEHFSQDRKVLFKKPNTGSFGHKTSMTTKSLSHVSHPPIDKKFQRKPPKKISLSSNQKTRTLSSISTERKLSSVPKPGNNSYQVGGLIKPEPGPTAVACIPVKLVFSRLYEELGSAINKS